MKKQDYTVINSAGVIILREKNTTMYDALVKAASEQKVRPEIAESIWLVIKTNDEEWFKKAVANWDKP